jgi:Family of unknown function (DUF5996)
MTDSMRSNVAATSEAWPSLPFNEWQDTYATLHMWTQIVGKIRLVQTPWVNHSWHVSLYVTARGLTTSPIPFGNRSCQIDFDFIDHRLLINVSDGGQASMALQARPVADFYNELMAKMAGLGLGMKIHTMPNEQADGIPFEQDYTHTSYEPACANRAWRVLVQADRVFKKFRSRFIGKSSPVHFFWGSFDLAVTRFSGRPAPEHPGGAPHCPDWVMREAYSHELSSCGFWPGSAAFPYPVFYAYAYPVPAGFDAAPVRPDQARYESTLGEFILPYEDVRLAPSPDEQVLEFLQSSYEAAARLGNWQRSDLEREELVKPLKKAADAGQWPA